MHAHEVIMNSFAEAVKDSPQPMSYWHERKHLRLLHGIINTSIIVASLSVLIV